MSEREREREREKGTPPDLLFSAGLRPGLFSLPRLLQLPLKLGKVTVFRDLDVELAGKLVWTRR